MHFINAFSIYFQCFELCNVLFKVFALINRVHFNYSTSKLCTRALAAGFHSHML